MRKVARALGFGLALLLGLAILFALWAWFASSRLIAQTLEARTERLARPTQVQLRDAPRQGRILGCVSCHGEGLAGKMMLDDGSVARVWAPNLTELAARTSDQQLAQGIRQGIGHDGRPLFIMPSPMYSRLSDSEVAALIAWIRSLPRKGVATSPIQWGPVGRFALAMGSFPSAHDRIEEFRVRQPFDTGPRQQAGRRLAANICSECHGADLSGGQPTPEDVAPGLSMAGAYDQEQFSRLLRTGLTPSGRKLGLMREVALGDTAYLTDTEIGQIHEYLRSRAERIQDPARP